MKCSNCHKEFANDLKECPRCGASVKEIVDLPKLSKEKKGKDNLSSNSETTKEFHFDFKTKPNADVNVDVKTKEYPMLQDDVKRSRTSLEDGENAADGGLKEDEEKTELSKKNLLKIKNDSSYDIKRRYLFISGLVGLMVIALLVFAYTSFRGENKNLATVVKDYKTAIKTSLNIYYQSGGKEYSDIVKVLEENYQDKQAIQQIQNDSLETINLWMSDIHTQNADDTDSFIAIIDYYKELINTLYIKAAYEDVYLLSESRKDEYLSTIDNLKRDGLVYYKGMDLYNERSYNEAYVALEKITSDNTYYNEATILKEEVVNKVLDLLKKDLDKLVVKESNEESLRVNALSIIKQYDSIYADLHLQENAEYQKLTLNYMSVN